MEKSIELLRKLTKHKYVELTERGNKAILKALKLAKERNNKEYILTVDQGGWITYLQYPKRIKKELRILETDLGIIDLEDLKQKSKDCTALIYSNPAGYYAEQPIKEIYNTCKKNDCLVILDVTGSLGLELCNGDYADYIVGSFGKWKPVNLGKGGFLSSNSEFDINNSLNEPELYNKLIDLKSRYDLFNKINQKIKKDLNEFQILHKEKKGINVIIGYSTKKEKDYIEEYCKKNNLQYTLCPRYIRVKKEAISIEVKRKEE